MSQDDWHDLCDYACFCGHGLVLLETHVKTENLMSSEEAQNIAQQMIEMDFLEDFKNQFTTRSPGFTHTDYPWWPKDKNAVMLSNVDISALDEKQQEAQYKADLLAISSDVAKVLKWLSMKKDTSKARKLAQAAHVRSQIHKGRCEVVEPFMNSNCAFVPSESITGVSAGFNTWVKAYSTVGSTGHGRELRVGFADCNKLGRMTGQEVDNLALNMQKLLAADPENSCCIVVLTTVHSVKNRLQGSVGDHGCFFTFSSATLRSDPDRDGRSRSLRKLISTRWLSVEVSGMFSLGFLTLIKAYATQCYSMCGGMFHVVVTSAI